MPSSPNVPPIVSRENWKAQISQKNATLDTIRVGDDKHTILVEALSRDDYEMAVFILNEAAKGGCLDKLCASTNNLGQNILHSAMHYSIQNPANLSLYFTIQNNYPDLFNQLNQSTDTTGKSPRAALFGALSEYTLILDQLSLLPNQHSLLIESLTQNDNELMNFLIKEAKAGNCIEKLLEARDSNNFNILHFAALYNRQDVIDYLKQDFPRSFANLLISQNNQGITPENLIDISTHKAVVDTIELGPDKHTLLEEALILRNPYLFEYTMRKAEEGKCLDKLFSRTNNDGENILHLASKYSDLSIYYGIKKDFPELFQQLDRIANNKGKTPNQAFKEIIIAHNHELDKILPNGANILVEAFISQDKEMVDFILEQAIKGNCLGKLLEYRNIDNQNILHLAILCNREDVLSLLQQGAPLSYQKLISNPDNQGVTPTELISKSDHQKINLEDFLPSPKTNNQSSALPVSPSPTSITKTSKINGFTIAGVLLILAGAAAFLISPYLTIFLIAFGVGLIKSSLTTVEISNPSLPQPTPLAPRKSSPSVPQPTLSQNGPNTILPRTSSINRKPPSLQTAKVIDLHHTAVYPTKSLQQPQNISLSDYTSERAQQAILLKNELDPIQDTQSLHNAASNVAQSITGLVQTMNTSKALEEDINLYPIAAPPIESLQQPQNISLSDYTSERAQQAILLKNELDPIQDTQSLNNAASNVAQSITNLLKTESISKEPEIAQSSSSTLPQESTLLLNSAKKVVEGFQTFNDTVSNQRPSQQPTPNKAISEATIRFVTSTPEVSKILYEVIAVFSKANVKDIDFDASLPGNNISASSKPLSPEISVF
jgi:hypothetical protein